MTSVRDELQAAGCAVVEDDGLRAVPPSVAALGRAVAVVRARKLALRVRGGGDAPLPPAAGGVLLDLSSLDRISSIDGATGIARVEAGCSMAALEQTARRAGGTLGPLLPSVRAGSVGAWLAGPTRGERGIPGARRETAALSVAAVLADGRIAESRAAPRSATGPDLDHLALGGSGRLAVVAAAWVRLFPASPALVSSWRCEDGRAAIRAVERLCLDRVAPVRARLSTTATDVRLGLAWEGLESAPLERDRAARILERLGLALDPATTTSQWVREALPGHAVEIDARWSDLAKLPTAEAQLIGLHAGGSFAVIALAEGASADVCAGRARAANARVIAPRRLRDAGPGWDALGAGAAWQRLVAALGAGE